MSKISVYLTTAERSALRAVAEQRGVSQNYVMRIALRREVGLPTGLKQALQLVAEVAGSKGEQ